MEYTNKMYGLIPPNIYFPLSKFPVEYGYHGKGLNNLMFYLELYAAQNRYSIFCNGKKISSNASKKYYRLFRCTHLFEKTYHLISSIQMFFCIS